MSKLKVNLKWGKEKFTNIELDTSEPPLVFKSQIFALTGVPPERQKVMGVKGGTLKDDSDWSKLNIKNGQTFMLIGTKPENALKAPTQATVFVEDLSSEQAAALERANYPPGLVNLGNTCYMNSTIQCLLKISELKTALQQFQASGSFGPRLVATSFRDLAKNMDDSQASVIPLAFLQAFRDAFPQFAEQREGHYLQQDAEECWTQLVNCLKNELPALPAKDDDLPYDLSKSSITQLTYGVMTSKLKCTESDDPEEESSHPFSKLVCHISINTDYMFEGLRQGLEEELEKTAPSLGRTAVFKKTSRIARLPRYLTVQFMRFFYKRQINRKAKIGRPVSFPFYLDMYELCTPELKEKLKPKRDRIRELEDEKVEKKKQKMESADDETPEEDQPQEMDVDRSSEENYKFENLTGYYELCAILTHQGRSADSGHYIAWVLGNDGKWLKFDDDKVSEVSEDEVKKLSGKGGLDWHIAYLCLYRSRNFEGIDV